MEPEFLGRACRSLVTILTELTRPLCLYRTSARR